MSETTVDATKSSRVQFLGTDEKFVMLDDKWTYQKKDKIDTNMTSSRPCWEHSKTTGSLEAVRDSWSDKLTDRCLAPIVVIGRSGVMGSDTGAPRRPKKSELMVTNVRRFPAWRRTMR